MIVYQKPRYTEDKLCGMLSRFPLCCGWLFSSIFDFLKERKPCTVGSVYCFKDRTGLRSSPHSMALQPPCSRIATTSTATAYSVDNISNTSQVYKQRQDQHPHPQALHSVATISKPNISQSTWQLQERAKVPLLEVARQRKERQRPKEEAEPSQVHPNRTRNPKSAVVPAGARRRLPRPRLRRK